MQVDSLLTELSGKRLLPLSLLKFYRLTPSPFSLPLDSSPAETPALACLFTDHAPFLHHNVSSVQGRFVCCCTLGTSTCLAHRPCFILCETSGPGLRNDPGNLVRMQIPMPGSTCDTPTADQGTPRHEARFSFSSDVAAGGAGWRER